MVISDNQIQIKILMNLLINYINMFNGQLKIVRQEE